MKGKAFKIAAVASFAVLLAAATILDTSQTQLSELELFNRCYAHITRARPALNNPLRASVAAGTLTAVNACMQLLAKASLQPMGSANEGALVNSSAEGLLVLQAMNDMHRLWFANDNMATSINTGDHTYYRTRDLHDETEPALHFTRALFTSGAQLSDVVTLDSAMEALRTGGPRNESSMASSDRLKQPSSNGDIDLGADLVQIGDLIGVRRIKANSSKLNQLANTGERPILNNVYYPTPPTLKVHESAGAGILGTKSFLILNLGRQDILPMNGGLRMARRWSKTVLHDLLCRDLPALRVTDASPFVQTTVTAATPPFRKNQNCMACHATMDPMAASMRNLSLYFTPRLNTTDQNISAQIAVWPVTQPAETGVVDDDRNFYTRPTNGRLFYRSHTGALIDRQLANLNDLGLALSQTEDLYVCTAAKYFKHFTGIGVNLQDPGDPTKPPLDSSEQMYRDEVVRLGRELMATQSLQTLVRSIISGTMYRNASMRNAAP